MDRASAWMAEDPDPETRAELAALIARGAHAELADRFAGALTFGTAGLRGQLGAGPNRMNRAVVRRTTAGLARHLPDAAPGAGPVLVGYDARHKSEPFARDTAAVLAGAGLDAALLPGPLPTPVLAFAVRHLGAAAGVMITASHNPPRDNGYKVYLGGESGGAQVAPPADREIEAAIAGVGPLPGVALSDGYRTLDRGIVEAYLDAVVADRVEVADGPARAALRVAYTPLHGVGAQVLTEAFRRAGFAGPVAVPEQVAPDPDFPTVAFPNPEEPGAMDLVLDLAKTMGADVVIANDPDADRCAVACGGTLLTGDEVGVLLADALLRAGVSGTYATTIVSSSLLGALCAEHGVPYARTLTGFKWIMRAAGDLAFGYEEALGYAVAPDLVRDKDGISAALLVAELAAHAKARGRTLRDRLDELAARHGVHATRQVPVRVEHVAEIGALMARLRESLPPDLVGEPLTEVEDLLPDADVVIMRSAGYRMVVRPSGTEPKLKAYLETVVPVSGDVAAARSVAQARLADLAARAGTVLGV